MASTRPQSFMQIGTRKLERLGNLDDCLNQIKQIADNLPESFLLHHTRCLVLYLRDVDAMCSRIKEAGFESDEATYLDMLQMAEDKVLARRLSDVKVLTADYRDKREEWKRSKANLNRAISEMKGRAAKYDGTEKKALLLHALKYYQNIMSENDGMLAGESESTDALIEQYKKHRDEITKIPSICDGIAKMLADIRKTAAAADRQAAPAGGAVTTFQSFVDEWWESVVLMLQRLPIVSAEKSARDALQVLKQMKFDQAERRKREAARLAKLLAARSPSPSAISTPDGPAVDAGSAAAGAETGSNNGGARGWTNTGSSAGGSGFGGRGAGEERNPESSVPASLNGDASQITSPPGMAPSVPHGASPFDGSGEAPTPPARGGSFHASGGGDLDDGDDDGTGSNDDRASGGSAESGSLGEGCGSASAGGRSQRMADAGLPSDVESDSEGDDDGDSFGTTGRLRVGSSSVGDDPRSDGFWGRAILPAEEPRSKANSSAAATDAVSQGGGDHHNEVRGSGGAVRSGDAPGSATLHEDRFGFRGSASVVSGVTGGGSTAGGLGFGDDGSDDDDGEDGEGRDLFVSSTDPDVFFGANQASAASAAARRSALSTPNRVDIARTNKAARALKLGRNSAVAQPAQTGCKARTPSGQTGTSAARKAGTAAGRAGVSSAVDIAAMPPPRHMGVQPKTAALRSPSPMKTRRGSFNTADRSEKLNLSAIFASSAGRVQGVSAAIAAVAGAVVSGRGSTGGGGTSATGGSGGSSGDAELVRSVSCYVSSTSMTAKQARDWGDGRSSGGKAATSAGYPGGAGAGSGVSAAPVDPRAPEGTLTGTPVRRRSAGNIFVGSGIGSGSGSGVAKASRESATRRSGAPPS